jgi:hypothetical protein
MTNFFDIGIGVEKYCIAAHVMEAEKRFRLPIMKTKWKMFVVFEIHKRELLSISQTLILMLYAYCR